MKTRKVVRILSRLTLGCAVLAVIFFGIGMLPGRIEGVYRDKGVRCMCGGAMCMQFRDGKVITFNSNHGSAEMFGRYETNTDGSVSVFMSPSIEGESEKLFATAVPRFWFTRIGASDGGSGEWYWKFPVKGNIAKVISDQEITSSMTTADHNVVKTIYNPALEKLRTETKPLNTKASDQHSATRSKL